MIKKSLNEKTMMIAVKIGDRVNLRLTRPTRINYVPWLSDTTKLTKLHMKERDKTKEIASRTGSILQINEYKRLRNFQFQVLGGQHIRNLDKQVTWLQFNF